MMDLVSFFLRGILNGTNPFSPCHVNYFSIFGRSPRTDVLLRDWGVIFFSSFFVIEMENLLNVTPQQHLLL